MQNQKLKQQFDYSKKERQDIEARENELMMKEKQKQNKMKQEMEGFLEKNKEFRKLELKETNEIHEFYNTVAIKNLNEKYNEQLFHL